MVRSYYGLANHRRQEDPKELGNIQDDLCRTETGKGKKIQSCNHGPEVYQRLFREQKGDSTAYGVQSGRNRVVFQKDCGPSAFGGCSQVLVPYKKSA